MQQILWRIPIKFGWAPDGIPIYGFGMMLFVAFLVCTWLAGRRAVRVGVRKENIQDLVIWLFLGGLLGARIVFLRIERASEWHGWSDFFYNLPRIWDGGIVLYGAFLGGLLGYLGAWWFIFRKLPVTTLQLADVLAPSIALGLCLGRLGCLLNGCCFGQVACADCAVYPAIHFPMSAPPRERLVEGGVQTAAGFTYAAQQSGPGAVVGKVAPDSPAANSDLRGGDHIVAANGQPIQSADELSKYLADQRVWRGKKDLQLTVIHEGESKRTELRAFVPRTLGLYPTQVYESVSMALLLLLLFAYEPFRRRPGQLMAVLMIGYAIHRYLNEKLRDDPRPEGFEIYTSMVLLAAGIILWLWLQLSSGRPKAASAAVGQPAAAAV
jgi:prolipoprotein diacylglyceryltransferase